MRELDPNPRGGMRGGRGIAVRDGEIFVANFDTVYRYDRSGGFTPFVSHPSCSDIHEIAFKGDLLLVTSTRNDLLLAFDEDANLARHYNARAWSGVRERLGWEEPNRFEVKSIYSGRIDFRDPTSHDKASCDTAHVNSVCVCPDGEALVTMGLVVTNPEANEGKAAVVRLRDGASPEVIYVQKDTTVAIHNLLIQPDGTLLFLDTGGGALVRLNRDTGALLSRSPFPSRYLRGLHRFNDGRLAIGDQNSILLYDPAVPSPCSRILISANPRESVHSIATIKDT
jgi:hypothetical protein